MAKSRTTNITYYFARRKDTGMAGVWFTHCATYWQKERIISRLMDKACFHQVDVCAPSGDIHDTRFPVSFLEDHFVKTVKVYVRDTANSIAYDLTLKVLQENNPDIIRIP